MATLKPTTPLHAPNKGPLKPPSPLRPQTAPKTLISHPQRRRRFQPHTGTSKQRRQGFQLRLSLREQRRRRFHTTGPPGRQDQAAAAVGGGGAWPGFEPTRRAKLAARTARGRAAPPTGTSSSPARLHPQRHEAATGFPAAASSRSRSGAQHGAASDQAVMST